MTRIEQLRQRFVAGMAQGNISAEDWEEEFLPMLEDAARWRFLRNNALPGYSQSGTPWSVHYSRERLSNWPEIQKMIDSARTTTKEPACQISSS